MNVERQWTQPCGKNRRVCCWRSRVQKAIRDDDGKGEQSKEARPLQDFIYYRLTSTTSEANFKSEVIGDIKPSLFVTTSAEKKNLVGGLEGVKFDTMGQVSFSVSHAPHDALADLA